MTQGDHCTPGGDGDGLGPVGDAINSPRLDQPIAGFLAEGHRQFLIDLTAARSGRRWQLALGRLAAGGSQSVRMVDLLPGESDLVNITGLHNPRRGGWDRLPSSLRVERSVKRAP